MKDLFISEQKDKTYNNIAIKKCNLETLNLCELFPNIKKLKIKTCILPLMDLSQNFKINQLKELYLENIGLFNTNFNEIITCLKSNNSNFIENIKILSVKNNKLSEIDSLFLPENSIYKNLNFLNLSNNDFTSISNNILENLPSIKVLDISCNNVPFDLDLLGKYKSKNCLLVLSKNIGIFDEKNREEYCKYLEEILPQTNSENFPLKRLNFEGVFYGKTYPMMLSINFKSIFPNLTELNLTNNNINDNDLSVFISNNSENNVLKKFVLCSNNITEAGIELLINGEFNKKLLHLKKLELSGNPIKLSVEQLKKFLNTFSKLRMLKIKNTPIEKDINSYLKIKAERKRQELNNKELSNMTDVDLQYEEFLCKEHYLKEKTNVTLNIINFNGMECLKLIKNYYPDLLERFKIEKIESKLVE